MKHTSSTVPLSSSHRQTTTTSPQCQEQCGAEYTSTVVECGYPAFVISVAERLHAGAEGEKLAMGGAMPMGQPGGQSDGDEVVVGGAMGGAAAAEQTPVLSALQSMPHPGAGSHGPVGPPFAPNLMKNRASDRMTDSASFGIGGNFSDFSKNSFGGTMDNGRGQKHNRSAAVGAVGQGVVGSHGKLA
jgi:hypothetical protein